MKTHIITLFLCCFGIMGFSQSITNMECFFNTDPGFGNATAITANANTGSVTQTVLIPVNSLTGFNSFYVRAKNNLGIWSLYDKRIFYVVNLATGTSPTNIVAAEYFINTDPGFGNAMPIAVNTNTGILTQVLSLPIGSLQGFNTLYIRTKDDLGIWSMYDRRLFYIRKDTGIVIPDITAAEYFYDVDSGFGNGTAATLIPTANPDKYIVELATTDITCDFHDFYIRLKNTDGKWSLYDYKKDIEVYDNANPTIVVFPTITKELDALGKASITIIDVNNGTYDDCELVSVVLNQPQIDYTCANLGINTVKITATDAESKVSNLDVTITVLDKMNPVAVTKNITVQLDKNGEVSVLSSQIDNGSTDNCSVTGFSLDVSNFNCSNLGTNTVNLTVSDASGNTNTASAIVTVEDTVKPIVTTKAITLQLDATGNASITANDIDNGSIDNCTISSRNLDITTFTCANLGANAVTLTVTDQSGNSDAKASIVTIEDKIKPVVLTKNITIQLDANGQASLIASQIENGSTDNCGIASSNLDITSFTCNYLGSNTVTLSVTDSSANTGTNTAIVTVEDAINPVAIAKNITLQLDANGNATITPDDVDNSSTDNCSISLKSLDKSGFTCANLGVNTVVLTVEDLSRNTNTASATVTVEDNLEPTALGKDLIIYLNGNPSVSILPDDIDNGSFDNCIDISLSIDVDTFSSKGDFPVVLTATDNSGNSNSVTVVVTVDAALALVNNEQIANQIDIFPIPAQEYLNISTSLIINTIEIFDIDGRLVDKIQKPASKIEISKLASAMYFLKFYVDNKSVIKRIIKE